MEKSCCTCTVVKPLDSFHKHSRSADGRVSRCKACSKEFNKSWFQRHRSTRMTKRRQRIGELLAESQRLKREAGCLICKETEAVCLDWHHVDASQKEDNISQLIENNSATKFCEEIKKCVVLCSNCHRKVHAGLITLPN